ncbi:MAG TPA: hypothetical protein VJQ84_01615 [Solirubrobacterales bacterium]|nr:hypothetical protein [Solirubrobacterales bacterium]
MAAAANFGAVDTLSVDIDAKLDELCRAFLSGGTVLAVRAADVSGGDPAAADAARYSVSF